MRPQLRLYAVFRCQICARIPASFAMRNTSSSEASIALASERWCVKYAPPYRAATFAIAISSSVELYMSGTYWSEEETPIAPVAHGLVDEVAHLLQLLRGRAAVGLADDVVAHAAGADEGRRG